jgi:thioester reductase-like protein
LPCAISRKNADKYDLKLDYSRVILEKGDLSLSNFGMSQADWNRVSASIDFIVHCGAMVSLTAPYDGNMKNINVGGTLEAIKLAAVSSATLVFVSSNGIFPSSSNNELFKENEVTTCLPDRLGSNNGYGISKWAAEQLVIDASKKGLPTLSIRFGNIGWHSKTARGNSLDFQALILNGCFQLGKAINIHGWNFECTPVDFASKALVSLSSDVSLLNERHVLNCVQDGFTAFNDIFQIIAGVAGHQLPTATFESWSKVLEEKVFNANDESITALFSFVSGLEDCEAYLQNVPRLDCSVFDTSLKKIGSP